MKMFCLPRLLPIFYSLLCIPSLYICDPVNYYRNVPALCAGAAVKVFGGCRCLQSACDQMMTGHVSKTKVNSLALLLV